MIGLYRLDKYPDYTFVLFQGDSSHVEKYRRFYISILLRLRKVLKRGMLPSYGVNGEKKAGVKYLNIYDHTTVPCP